MQTTWKLLHTTSNLHYIPMLEDFWIGLSPDPVEPSVDNSTARDASSSEMETSSITQKELTSLYDKGAALRAQPSIVQQHANSFNGQKDPPPQPVMIENNKEYIVERIVDSQQQGCKHKYTEYLVKWQGYNLDPKNNEDRSQIQATAKMPSNTTCAILNLHRKRPRDKMKLCITN
ncbi:retrotransposable element protein [Planoprotostelium fungivorum]|uniref:Retrotransposable element protein n=1 Tax=Planoprotostelium fungivorum TaxID=1890364 RepID=A0A2P6NF50_9EUKA|nr:retrotransposable element protein [Planoprotostelium fungivorum]